MMAEADVRTSLGLASMSVATVACIFQASGVPWGRMVLVSFVEAVETNNTHTPDTENDSVVIDVRCHEGSE